jgi:hypothetical protein
MVLILIPMNFFFGCIHDYLRSDEVRKGRFCKLSGSAQRWASGDSWQMALLRHTIGNYDIKEINSKITRTDGILSMEGSS